MFFFDKEEFFFDFLEIIIMNIGDGDVNNNIL